MIPQQFLHLNGKRVVLAGAVVTASALYVLDRPRFDKYVKRPAQQTIGVLAAALGFVGNFVKDIASSKTKHDEWKLILQEIDDYLETTGLYQEWGAGVPDHLLRNVLVLNTIQQEHLADRSTLSAQPTPQNKDGLSSDNIRLAEHYMKFATAVYGMEIIASAQLQLDDMKIEPDHTLEMAIASHCNVKPDDILLADVQVGDSNEYLRHMVVIDHANKAVVLAVRGTISLSSLLVDLAAYSDPFCGGFAHSGMAKMAVAVWNKAAKSLEQRLHLVPKDYELVITGHSLGAGVACLITILLHDEEFRKSRKGEELPTKIRCMAYAPPPVFYPISAVPEAVSKTTAFVHHMDCVPSLSIASIRRLVKSINDIDLPLRSIPHLDTFPGMPAPAACVEALRKSSKEPLSEKPRAHGLCVPAGTLVWMKDQDGDGEQYSTMLLDPVLYSERIMDVHSRMVGDHMQPKYEQAFRVLVKQQENNKE